jgi:hypothetical protein
MAGSDKRRRPRQSLVRWTDEEFNALAAKADRAGLAVAAFIRAVVLGDPGPRAQRRPPADHKTLRQILGQIGRTGNNVNQIARASNTGSQANSAELKGIRRACQDMRKALLEALGKDPGPDT